jgi:hypothetical protein
MNIMHYMINIIVQIRQNETLTGLKWNFTNNINKSKVFIIYMYKFNRMSQYRYDEK